jgi:prolyl 4-hydroxylase
MINLTRKFLGRLKRALKKRMLLFRKYMSSHRIPRIPEPPVWEYPEGFTVSSIGQTGIRVVDNFLSPEEAQNLIVLHGKSVKRSTVIGPEKNSILHDYRTSSDTFISVDADPLVRATIFRAASLFGLPITHAESFSLTRYRHGEYYKAHLDHDGTMKADRLYTLLIYLNDLSVEDGGGTLFDKLNLIAHPVCGRAVLWVNSDLDKKARGESVHSSLPVLTEGAEKWVAQLWFRSYKFNSRARPIELSDHPAGIPVEQSTPLPTGISIPID